MLVVMISFEPTLKMYCIAGGYVKNRIKSLVFSFKKEKKKHLKNSYKNLELYILSNMKSSFSLLVAAIAAVNAQSAPYICQTTDASPYLNNINEMVDNLNAAPQGENLCNIDTNGCGKTVTGYSGSGGAAFMVCGSSYRVSTDNTITAYFLYPFSISRIPTYIVCIVLW